MIDDQQQTPPSEVPTDPDPSQSHSASSDPPQTFEQLELAATITGPGMRTADRYEPGAKLKIKGERGVFAYKHASVSSAGLVSLHLVGEGGGSRAVRPDQVTPVKKRRLTR